MDEILSDLSMSDPKVEKEKERVLLEMNAIEENFEPSFKFPSNFTT
jgi:hypothetical protein